MNAETALRRALLTFFAKAKVTAKIETIRSHGWASATFSGIRHELRFRLSGLSGCAVLDELGEREFPLPGHILVDIAAAETGRDGHDLLVSIEALTVVAD